MRIACVPSLSILKSTFLVRRIIKMLKNEGFFCLELRNVPHESVIN